jgi:hypothetical protein
MLLPVKNSVEWLILTAKTRIQLLEAGLKRGPLSVRNLTPGFGRVGESGDERSKNDSVSRIDAIAGSMAACKIHVNFVHRKIMTKVGLDW